ncbi:MAG: deoxyribodipyrimidine photo-lyase [Planctomycetes bacterium]|nr:deoxyribodipyrimidine photo-lyase [Planctomycetota bacterium]
MPASSTLVWFRQDLRLDDNPALRAALDRGGPIVPLYIWAPEEEAPWAPGAASRWWLHHSLAALQAELAKLGSRLLLRRGESLAELRSVAQAIGANAVYWNRRYEPAAIRRDAKIKRTLKADGMETESHNAALLFEPWTVQTGGGAPYQVFTPFWKACLKQPEPPEPLARPRTLPAPQSWPQSVSLDSLGLLPNRDWADGFHAHWTPGAKGARTALKRFSTGILANYSSGRDRPDQAGTSRLSPHLHFGEIGPREIWHAVRASAERASGGGWVRAEETYLREIGWREFAHHLLFHFPHTPNAPLRASFESFSWRKNRRALLAWQRGATGFPIVDAGLRELWHTGWMHNRVRMIVASFLVKDLLISWREGARWFWDTLVDADLANNTLGWQWTAGCGADAAPFFRIFNPVSQGEKFDPQGAYVRRWVPELKALPDRFLHRPWECPGLERTAAGVHLGKTYPHPIVDHAAAREEALAAFAALKRT